MGEVRWGKGEVRRSKCEGGMEYWNDGIVNGEVRRTKHAFCVPLPFGGVRRKIWDMGCEIILHPLTFQFRWIWWTEWADSAKAGVVRSKT
jgi:hypothetical protein